MAEFVQQNMEMMVPELETMLKIELFTGDEVRRITVKRKEFEYKLQRGTKYKEDLLNYIRYEWDLLVVVKNKTVENASATKRNNIAHSVCQRIQRLFSEAIRRFGGDVKIWLSYIDFCKIVRLHAAISQRLEEMLERHLDKPQLFCIAAQTEFEVLGSIDRARKFLLQGIHLHKKSEPLYKEAFAMELSYAKNLRKEYADRNEDIPDGDPILKGRLAELIFESAIINMQNVSLVADLFIISKKYPFVKDLCLRIHNYISDTFKESELRWDIVARTKLENLFEMDEVTTIPKDNIQACVAVYEEAVKTLNTDEMWSLYIDTMLQLNEDLSYLKNFKTNCLMGAFLGAHSAGKLKEDYYLKWASKLYGEHDKVKLLEVLKCGTQNHPGSSKLWEHYLKVLSVFSETSIVGNPATVIETFEEAVKSLIKRNQCTLTIWRFIISYAQLMAPNKAEELMIKGSNQSGEVGVVIKRMYVEWLVLSRGLKFGRKVYFDIASVPPFSLPLHKKMIELETVSAIMDVVKVRQCYELMVSQFGESDPDVWLDYIKFEQEKGDPKLTPPLYNRATKKLSPALAENFVSLYSLYMINIGDRKTKEEPEEPVAKIVKKSTET